VRVVTCNTAAVSSVVRPPKSRTDFDITGLLDGEPVNGVCPILYLNVGPILLNVLGLVVEVPDPIIVEIRAERGPGQLLGNLFCALVGILD
jgi:hypothetical protein